jgi:hypothetical protein
MKGGLYRYNGKISKFISDITLDTHYLRPPSFMKSGTRLTEKFPSICHGLVRNYDGDQNDPMGYISDEE